MVSIKDMVAAIAETGMSQAEIANRIGASQPTVHRILEKGHGTSYDTGKKIEQLYQELIINDRAA